MFADRHEYEEIEKLWDILLEISRSPGKYVAKDALEGLMAGAGDELDVIRYKHLLSEIQDV